jgi:hypothetical protein
MEQGAWSKEQRTCDMGHGAWSMLMHYTLYIMHSTQLSLLGDL